MYYVGIDPGSKGAICLLDPLKPSRTPWFLDLKDHTVDIFDILKMARPKMAHCAVEDVHSIFGMSAKSNFQFGAQIGRIHTMLALLEMPFELVQPKRWQKVTGIPSRKELPEGIDLKTFVAQRAQELYPTAELRGPKGGLLDGRSDALMITHYLLSRDSYELQANNEGATTIVPERPAKRNRSSKV